MLIEKKIPLNRIIQNTWKNVLVVTVYSTIITVANQYYGQDYLKFPSTIPGIMGTALSLFLGFRTNSAYDRWWEARKIWGSIVNDSRTLARQAVTFLGSADHKNAEEIKTIVYRQICWCYSLAGTLRKQPLGKYFKEFLNEEEIAGISGNTNRPNALLQKQEVHLKKLQQQGEMHMFELMKMDETLRRLCDSMGKCERIKNTVFPTQYSFFIHFFIMVFIFILPFGMVDYAKYFTIPLTGLLAFIFLMIETIEVLLQDPFEDRSNDTPMTALSRTIEINLKQQLGEMDTPPAITPKQGVLM
ncbi:bestrophin family ion channel [Flammeovirgaceae bacterium SG7u.132]|nr:bestrophin family ion channel [Flammeovirgaceae bacterium SG7u.132]